MVDLCWPTPIGCAQLLPVHNCGQLGVRNRTIGNWVPHTIGGIYKHAAHQISFWVHVSSTSYRQVCVCVFVFVFVKVGQNLADDQLQWS